MAKFKNLALLFGLQVTCALAIAPLSQANPHAKPAAPKKHPTPAPKLLQRVRGIVADVFHVDPKIVTPTADFVKDLGADELDIVDLAIRLEKVFHIEIPDEAMEKITNITLATNYIAKKLPKPK